MGTMCCQYQQVAVILLKLTFQSGIKTAKSLVSAKSPQLAGEGRKHRIPVCFLHMEGVPDTKILHVHLSPQFKFR